MKQWKRLLAAALAALLMGGVLTMGASAEDVAEPGNRIVRIGDVFTPDTLPNLIAAATSEDEEALEVTPEQRKAYDDMVELNTLYWTYMYKIVDLEMWLSPNKSERLLKSYDKIRDEVNRCFNEWAEYFIACDYVSAHKALQKATSMDTKFFQHQFTLVIPGELLKAMGVSSFVNFFRIMWSLSLRYLFFGWTVMP